MGITGITGRFDNDLVLKEKPFNKYYFSGNSFTNIGGDYAFGLSKGDLQQVNLSDPLETELLFGKKTTDTKTFHSQINVVFGFSYSF